MPELKTNITIPATYRNSIPIPEDSRYRMIILRLAGCECEIPLLGYEMDGETPCGPRCRTCNTGVRITDKET